MTSTVYQDYNQNTPITASWLNDVNNDTYTGKGTAKVAKQSAAAWVRFGAPGGIVSINQSVNILSVVRTGVGVYLITYTSNLVNAANCYSGIMGLSGFVTVAAETLGTVTIACTDHTNAPIDPSSISLSVFGDS